MIKIDVTKMNKTLSKKINEFCSENIAVSLLAIVGSVFIFGKITKLLVENPPYQGFYLLAYWVVIVINTIWGAVIFAYNVGSNILIVKEKVYTLQDEKLRKNLIIRGLIIPPLWFIGAFLSLAYFGNDLYFSGAASCYLLAGFMFVSNEWENLFSTKI